MISKFFKQIVILINCLAAFALLIAIISPYISPFNLRFIALFGLAYPYVLIVNLLFVIFWIILKSPYLLVSLSLIFIGLGRYVYPRLKANVPQYEVVNGQPGFSIMSFNVRVFDLYNWTNNKKSRDKIFSFIRREKPEIICFQEYFNSSNKKYFPVHDSLMQNQSFKYAHIHYTDNLKENHFGIATYSNYKIINKQAYPFKNTNNLFITSDVVIKKDTIRIINCHLESIRLNQKDYDLMDSISHVSDTKNLKGVEGIMERFDQAFKKRAHQADYLNYIMSKSPYPVICCGDFNDTPNSYAYQTISDGLYDSYETSGAIKGGTYNRFFPSFRIDFLLYSTPLSCTDYETFQVELSDHKPIMGRYVVASQQ